jgi:hypothetical protein
MPILNVESRPNSLKFNVRNRNYGTGSVKSHVKQELEDTKKKTVWKEGNNKFGKKYIIKHVTLPVSF